MTELPQDDSAFIYQYVPATDLLLVPSTGVVAGARAVAENIVVIVGRTTPALLYFRYVRGGHARAKKAVETKTREYIEGFASPSWNGLN